jgi:2-oxoisovalerate ferredoxin oxidoreductase delta subunit
MNKGVHPRGYRSLRTLRTLSIVPDSDRPFLLPLKILYYTSMNRIIINPDECKGCRFCVVGCPKHSITIGNDINKLGYQNAVFSEGRCTACGICFTICPEPGAITVIQERDLPANGQTTA